MVVFVRISDFNGSVPIGHNDKKNEIFTAVKLYDLYTKNQYDPYFLTKIFETVRSEKVQIVCRNHHLMMDDYYFDYLIHDKNDDD